MSGYHRIITAMGQEGWESLPPDVAQALRLYFEQHIHLPPDMVRQILDLKNHHPALRTPPGTAYRLLADAGRDGLGRLIDREPTDSDGAADIVYAERPERNQSVSSWTTNPSSLPQILWDVTAGDGIREDSYYAIVAAEVGENADSFMLNPAAFGGHGYDYQQEILSSGPVKARIAWLKTDAFDPDSWHWDSDDKRHDWEEMGALPEGAGEDLPDPTEIVAKLLKELE